MMKNDKESMFGLKGKLLFMVGSAMLALIGLSIYSGYTIYKMSDIVSYLGKQRIPITKELGDVRSSSNGMPRFMWLSLAQAPGSVERKKSLEKVNSFYKDLVDSTAELEKYELVDKAKEHLDAIKAILPDLGLVIKDGVKLLELGNVDQQVKELLMIKMPPLAVKLTEETILMEGVVEQKNKSVISDSEAFVLSSTRSLIAISSIISLVFGLFGFFFATKLAKSLTSVAKMIADSSRQVASASQQVSAASHQLSSASAEQASAVEETSASLEEISGMVENNVRSAENGVEIAESVRAVSEKSGESIKTLIAAMAEVLESNKRIENLVKVINEIGEKTEVIDEIVFQTKLLSFNASVEAERAGEHGRGFAVVAQEVGNLAQMSGKAALEISAIVKSSIKEAQEIASENKKKVEKGNEYVFETADALNEIKKDVDSVLTGSRQILSASKEQSTGIKQINTAIENISKATQETAATSEESASAGEELSGQAFSLDKLVSELNLIVTGKANNGSYTDSSDDESVYEEKKKIVNISHFKDKKNQSEIQQTQKFKKIVGGDESSNTGNDGWDKL